MATAVKKKVKPKPKSKAKTQPKAKPAPKRKQVNKKPAPKKRQYDLVRKDESLELPDNAVIDLSAYDWGGEKLTDNQKLFVVWFTTPGTKCYHRVMPAALKAGYAKDTAHVTAYKLRNDPRIDKLIRQFDDNLGKVNVRDTVERWIQEKIIRGDYKVSDYYKTVYYEDRLGNPKQKLMLKPIEELTEDQVLCIDGVDVKGQQGTPIYLLPDKEKLRDSFIAMVRKQDMDNENTDFEEETMEIIMERLTVKKTIRKEKDEISQMAGLIRQAKGDPITEL